MCLLVQWVILKITGRKSLDTWWGNPCQLCYFHFQRIGDGQLDLYLEHVDAWSTPDRFSMHYVTLLTVHSLRSLLYGICTCGSTLMHFKCRFRFPNGPIWTRILLSICGLNLHYCGVHMLMSNVPDIQQASGFQYSKEPRQCLDLDIQLILRLLGFNIPESLVNAWTWIFIGNSNPHLFKDWCFQLSHMSLEFGEVTWKAHIGRFSRRSWRCIWCLMLKCIFQKPIIFCWPNLKDVPYSLHALKLTIGS